jgi:hypothetical protein
MKPSADSQPNGIEKILPIGQIDAAEKELLGAAVKELGPSIEKVGGPALRDPALHEYQS